MIDHLGIVNIQEVVDMKREEKNLQSRQKIMEAALEEFGARSYTEASMNTICKEGGVSKGIIYHYFKDKDELYLACLQECFDALTDHLRTGLGEEEAAEVMIQRYFDSRIIFFDKYPAYLRLFCSAVITPPAHLAEEIGRIRKGFDDLNLHVLTSMLEKVSLRKDITAEEVVEEFKLYQDFVNAQYQMQTLDQVGIEEHEKRCSRTLKILLYGVVERGPSHES